MGSPGIPPERAAVLRKAAMDMFRDPGFVAEMKRLELDVEPMAGEELAAVVAEVARAPRDIVELLKTQTAPMD
jgi:tripartite-type tricarboxylate transporter receptor subunit TctC